MLQLHFRWCGSERGSHDHSECWTGDDYTYAVKHRPENDLSLPYKSATKQYSCSLIQNILTNRCPYICMVKELGHFSIVMYVILLGNLMFPGHI